MHLPSFPSPKSRGMGGWEGVCVRFNPSVCLELVGRRGIGVLKDAHWGW